MNRKKCYLLAFATVLIWATMATVIKLLLADIPDLESLCVSSIFVLTLMIAINAVTGKFRLLKKYRPADYVKMAGLGFLGLFMYSAFYYYGISILTSQEACIINYTWPVMVLIFSWNAKKVLAMLCSFAGIVVLVFGGGTDMAGNQVAGVLTCLTAAVCYGPFCILNNKKADYDQNILMMTTWAVVMIFSFALGKFTENWVPIQGLQWAGMVWLGAVIDAVAYLTWAIALNSTDNTAAIANLAYLTPFISMVISAIVLKERITFSAVIAFVLIVGGILLQSIPMKRKTM